MIEAVHFNNEKPENKILFLLIKKIIELRYIAETNGYLKIKMI